MNCTQGRFGAQMRWIERCLAKIDNPSIIVGRSLSPSAKAKELEALIGKLAEARHNCQTESDQEWLNSVGQSLKQRVMEEINHPILKRGGDLISPTTFLKMTITKINSKEFYTFIVNKYPIQVLKSDLDKNQEMFEYFKSLEKKPILS